MPIKVDFTGAAEFDPVPNGAYVLRIESYEQKESGENSKVPGTPMLNWTLIIVEPEEYTGKKMFNNSMLAGPGTGFTRAFLKAFDPTNAANYDGDSLEFEPDDFIGRQAYGDVKGKTLPDGRPGNEVKKFSPL